MGGWMDDAGAKITSAGGGRSYLVAVASEEAPVVDESAVDVAFADVPLAHVGCSFRVCTAPAALPTAASGKWIAFLLSSKSSSFRAARLALARGCTRCKTAVTLLTCSMRSCSRTR